MSDLPRLLFCCFDVVPAPTALSRRVTEYLKTLSDRYQVVVLSVKTPDHTHIERYQGARLLRVPVGSGDLPSRVQAFDRAVRRQLESEDYVLVHFFDPFGGYALCERHDELGYKLVYDASSFPSVELPHQSPNIESNRRFLAKVRRQELFCLMNADAVVVGSTLTREYVASLGVSREQVHVLRAPVDLSPYTPEVMGRPDATPMKVVHLGSQGGGRGLSTLLEALQLALQTVDVRLAVVGPKSDEWQARLEEQIASLKLSGKVELQAHVAHDDVHKILATADAGALTLDDVERNQKVGTSLSRLGEYLAAGRPVIAADVAAVKAIAPDDGVVYYRAGDARSLADAIVSLAVDPARRVKLGEAARAAAKAWDANLIRADLVALYATLAEGTVRRSGDDAAPPPGEVTQLGRPAISSDSGVSNDGGDVTQLGARPPGVEDSSPGAGKVKTDPAISRPDTSTDSQGPGERPAIMGVPLRDAARVETTEPGIRREPPVVIGSPLPEVTPLASVAVALEQAVPAPLPVFDLPAEPRPPDDGIVRHFEDTPQTDVGTPEVMAARAELLKAPPPPRPPSPPKLPPLGSAPPPPPKSSELERAKTSKSAVVPPLSTERKSSQSGVFTARDLPEPERAKPASSSAAPERTKSSQSGIFSARDLPAPELPHPAKPASSASGNVATPAVSERTKSSQSGVFTARDLPPELPPLPEPAKPASSASGIVAAPVAPERTKSSQSGVFTARDLPPELPPLFEPASSAKPSQSGVFARPVSSPSGVAAPERAKPPALPSASAARVPSPAPPELLPTETPVIAPLVLPPISAPPPFKSGKSTTPFAAMPPPAVTPPSAPPMVIPPLELPSPPPPAPMLAKPPPPVPPDTSEDAEEVSSDEVVEVSDEAEELAEDEAIQTVDTDSSPPPSALDPWLAQLVHGYCPPESHLFDRHTPPTTMPGRDT